MIVPCPNCATRYDIDAACFTEAGRTLSCVVCEHVWFVPPPEPVTAFIKPKNAQRAGAAFGAGERNPFVKDARPEPHRVDGKVRFADEPAPGVGSDADDRLFDVHPSHPAGDVRTADKEPSPRKEAKAAEKERPPEERRAAPLRADPPAAKADARPAEPDRAERARRGFGFGARSAAAEPADDRDESFLDVVRRRAAASRPTDGSAARAPFDETLAFADPAPRDPDRGGYDVGDDGVLDAEFEAVDEEPHADGPAAAESADESAGFGGFGRRPEPGRALAPLDVIDEAAERVFNEAFFKALRVQPKDLERAIRKARRRAEAREKNRLTPARAFGWMLWAGVVGASVFAVHTYRDAIVSAWPRAVAAYEIVGLKVAAGDLRIADVEQRLAMSTEGPTIEITGRLVNVADEAMTAPLMQAEAFSSAGELLARWTFTPAQAVVEPGADAPFQTRARAPEGLAEVSVSFAPTAVRPRVGPGLAADE